MKLISMVLMTAWMFCVVLGFTAGGFAHLLGIASAAIVLMSGNRPHIRRESPEAKAARRALTHPAV